MATHRCRVHSNCGPISEYTLVATHRHRLREVKCHCSALPTPGQVHITVGGIRCADHSALRIIVNSTTSHAFDAYASAPVCMAAVLCTGGVSPSIDGTDCSGYQRRQHFPSRTQTKVAIASPMVTILDFVRTHYRSWLLIWLPFLLIWAWGVRYNPLTDGPGYGDALEVVRGMASYADFLRNGTNPLYNPLVFYPTGWHTATLAHTPVMLLLMGLADLWLPAALVYNLTVFASFAVCYAGMRRLVSLYVTQRWIVILVALLYTFWGMRWLRLFGHLHTAWLSALLPWMVWFLLADLPARRRIWGAGLLWGCAIVASLYSIWLGALVAVVYVVTQFSVRALRDSIYMGLIALIMSSPVLVIFWQANQASDLYYHGIEHVVYWSASLNSLFVPFVLHPWWQKVAALFYPGPYDESGILNFGLTLSLVAIVGLFAVRRKEPAHRFAVVAAGLGLIFALGPILRWSGKPVQFPAPDPAGFLSLASRANAQTRGVPGTLAKRLCRRGSIARLSVLCRTAVCRRRPCRRPFWVRCCAWRLSIVGAGAGTNSSCAGLRLGLLCYCSWKRCPGPFRAACLSRPNFIRQ